MARFTVIADFMNFHIKPIWLFTERWYRVTSYVFTYIYTRPTSHTSTNLFVFVFHEAVLTKWSKFDRYGVNLKYMSFWFLLPYSLFWAWPLLLLSSVRQLVSLCYHVKIKCSRVLWKKLWGIQNKVLDVTFSVHI